MYSCNPTNGDEALDGMVVIGWWRRRWRRGQCRVRGHCSSVVRRTGNKSVVEFPFRGGVGGRGGRRISRFIGGRVGWGEDGL